MNLSIVVPLYNEDESLPELEAWIRRVVESLNLSYEIILVDDGSSDNSWSVIEQLSQKNSSIRGIRFRRNYGKSAALYCGFEAAQGDVVITMDADLQDSPDEIPELYSMINNDKYHLVSGWKQKRYDPIMKTVPSKLFNKTASLMSGIKLHDFNCGLKAYDKEVIKNIEVYGEMHRYIPFIAAKAGFTNITEKVVQHRARQYGVTKFGLSRFINGYLDLMSIWFISKFGKRPMHLFGAVGTVVFLIGFISAIAVGASKLWALHNGLSAPLVTSNPYFYISIISMVIGVQLFLSGFVGELISRSSSDRNQYQIKSKI